MYLKNLIELLIKKKIVFAQQGKLGLSPLIEGKFYLSEYIFCAMNDRTQILLLKGAFVCFNKIMRLNVLQSVLH